MLTASSEKNFSLIASTKEKNTRNTVKITFSCSLRTADAFPVVASLPPKNRTADAFPVVASLPPKISVCEPERQNDFPWRKTSCFDVGQSDQRIEYSSSDSSRPRALKYLGFWRELSNTLWNVNFTTITRFPATLNADFFMKQLLLKLCMWCGPLVSLYKIR